MAKQKKTRDATEELLSTMRRINLEPLEIMQRAIVLAEADSDYKAMMDGALGVMPYMYPKLKESVVKADIDQTLNGNGVNLNITIGDQKVNVTDDEDKEE
ncbi:hypothetical protein [Salmonella phage SE4]|uniref:hypothetical protein n=1 Tax=Salmonella phage SE4 TaxID=2575328 RepID=UPI0011D2E7C1|nr:hypothetical protein HWC20_gp61 [Salmonella phage SE4]QEG07787.1 hypothetical protein [Salmonella phage SE4]